MFQKIKFRWVVIVLIIASHYTLSSCKSDDNSKPNNFLTASIDDITFETTGVQVNGNIQNTDSGQLFILKGMTPDNRFIFLAIVSDTNFETGSYEISNASMEDASATYSVPIEGSMNEEPLQYNADFNSTSPVGSITITSISNMKVTGTFEFIGTEIEDPSLTVNVSDGEFSFLLPR